MFILLMQFLWLYIDDLAGKGLSWFVILKLMFFFSASIIPLALPLSILLSSIMTFGNLGETYELVAAKAAGVSIWKIFQPMFFVMIGLSFFAFFTSNILIPKANLKKSALLYDIKQQKPTLLISDGVFYNGIEGITLRVGKKNKKTEELSDIIIYDRRDGAPHATVIVAEHGRITMSEDKRYMFLTLYNGSRYEEMDKQQGYERTFPHSTLTFNEEKIVFDMYDFKLNRTDEALFKDNYQMLNVVQLHHAIDSLNESIVKKGISLKKNFDQYFHLNDSLYKRFKPQTLKSFNLDLVKNMDTIQQDVVLNNALNEARSAKGYVEYSLNDRSETEKLTVRHDIEWHRKFTLSVACFVMFFIGAPFGTIIRKGGFGMPVVVSIVLYIIFHILTITGEKMARTESATPASGMWMAIFVLIPIGFFLTYQAANDSGLFDKSAWVKLVHSITRWRNRNKTK
jgi:lipopolysaccharide export system permease protein